MNPKYMLLITGLAVFTFISCPAFATDDEWTDYAPCGWNVEQETDDTVAELQWTDYDPCGWNAETEAVNTATVAELEWTNYDPCGRNVEDESVSTDIVAEL